MIRETSESSLARRNTFFLGLAEAYGGTAGGASGGPTYVRRKLALFIPASTEKRDKIANPLWKNRIDSSKR